MYVVHTMYVHMLRDVFGPWNHPNWDPNQCQYHKSNGFIAYILYPNSNMYVYACYGLWSIYVWLDFRNIDKLILVCVYTHTYIYIYVHWSARSYYGLVKPQKIKNKNKKTKRKKTILIFYHPTKWGTFFTQPYPHISTPKIQKIRKNKKYEI